MSSEVRKLWLFSNCHTTLYKFSIGFLNLRRNLKKKKKIFLQRAINKIQIITFEVNSIGIRREISSRENPRFPPLRKFQSILFQPSTIGIIYTDTISNTRCRRKCRSAVNVCKLRRERSEITGRPELLLGSLLLPSSLLPYLLSFSRDPSYDFS